MFIPSTSDTTLSTQATTLSHYQAALVLTARTPINAFTPASVHRTHILLQTAFIPARLDAIPLSHQSAYVSLDTFHIVHLLTVPQPPFAQATSHTPSIFTRVNAFTHHLSQQSALTSYTNCLYVTSPFSSDAVQLLQQKINFPGHVCRLSTPGSTFTRANFDIH